MSKSGSYFATFCSVSLGLLTIAGCAAGTATSPGPGTAVGTQAHQLAQRSNAGPDTKAIFNIHIFDPNDSGLGVNPQAGLYQDPDKNLFGSTKAGGVYTYGNAFEITPAGAFTDLHDFGGGEGDGAFPIGVLIPGANGVLYGTTSHGGTGCFGRGCGTVFALAPNGSGGYTESVLYRFADTPDGAIPQAGVILHDGVLYGTTSKGGANGHGAIYSLTLAGQEKVIYSFTGGVDGERPDAALFAYHGKLYGTAAEGTTRKAGTVFSVTPAGAFTVIHTFGEKLDGADPEGPLVVSAHGILFGTTSLGGANGFGMVYGVSPNGETYNPVYNFKGAANGDGEDSLSGLTVGSGGTLYGTTNKGGTGPCTAQSIVVGCGTLFELKPNGNGGYAETVLHQFQGVSNEDGDGAASAVIIESPGMLAGTTNFGGESGSICPAGCGVVYAYR